MRHIISSLEMASPEEMARLTSQVRQRTEDLQAYMRDLDTWQQDMEARDQQLRQKARDAAGDKAASKRKTSGQDKEAESSAAEDAESDTSKRPKEQRISSYDYRQWDKFDVDKALQDMDSKEGKDKVQDEDSEEDEARLAQEAAALKEKGNQHFKRGDFDRAVECYTRGILCDPRSAVLPANRAMALLKKGGRGALREAEADCTVALDLDPTYVKALQRRATARLRLGRLEESLSDFEGVLRLEPGDRLAKGEVERIKKALAAKKKQEEKKKEEIVVPKGVSFKDNLKGAFSNKSSQSPTSPPPAAAAPLLPGQVVPVTKKPSERSKKGLKRIEIVEIGDVEESAIIKKEETTPSRAPLLPEPAAAASSKSRGLALAVEKEISASLEKTTLGKPTTSTIPPKPKNSVQFMRAWKSLDAKSRALYLQKLSYQDYAAVFRHSLEPGAFSEVLEALPEVAKSSNALEHLAGLASVPRIGAIAMLMDAEDEERVKRVMEAARARGQSCDEDRMKVIRKTFTFLQ